MLSEKHFTGSRTESALPPSFFLKCINTLNVTTVTPQYPYPRLHQRAKNLPPTPRRRRNTSTLPWRTKCVMVMVIPFSEMLHWPPPTKPLALRGGSATSFTTSSSIFPPLPLGGREEKAGWCRLSLPVFTSSQFSGGSFAPNPLRFGSEGIGVLMGELAKWFRGLGFSLGGYLS